MDAEQDCPPYLETWRGMRDGAPRLLELLRGEGLPATFFTTGDAASRFPDFVEDLLADGHELGCHGMTHRAFTSMEPAEAEAEIAQSTAILRAHGAVTAFRAPYLRFPDEYLPLLEDAGYRTDSSRSLYKPAHWGPSAPTRLTRFPASITSSWLRLPREILDSLLHRLPSPVVLFVHPWEFVDMSGEPVPWDCRAGTGRSALRSLRRVLRTYRDAGASFSTLGELVGDDS